MTTRYTRDHEWIRLDGDVAGDIVFVELPEVGKKLEKGAEAAVVESVKAASEVFAPVTGEVVEVNGTLSDQPAAVNEDPEGNGWFMRMRVADKASVDGLMDAAGYKAFLETI
jgi:glycine cleavage system H protein